MPKIKGPKILLVDIETSPLVSYHWGLFDQNIGLNQLKQDWAVIAWCAKWLGEKKIYYQDSRNSKNILNDGPILKPLWELLDSCDLLISQNGVSFDVKKLNARFILNGMKPPSSFRNIDTKRIASKKFGFTSNKLEYLTKNLCTKYKKSSHKKFPGFELWSECLKGNKQAWNEMKKYNIYDVLSLEELYTKLQPWDNTYNPNVYLPDGSAKTCACGSTNLIKYGFRYTNAKKTQRYKCNDCGADI